MCGIVGIYSQNSVAAELYDSLIHLQHRGQDAAGILTSSERFYVKQGKGYVREIFSSDDVAQLHGNMGLGHVRYPTAGGYGLSDVQPLWIGSPRGIALAHNGNLINYPALAAEMTQQKHRHLNSSTDSEVLLHLIAEGLEQTPDAADDGEAFFQQLCAAIQYVFSRAQGSFSVVSKIIGKGLVAFRDPHGIRPLVSGVRRHVSGQSDYIFASEDSMFSALNFISTGDVQSGEVIFVNRSGRVFRKQLQTKTFSPCIFEYVYFARPDSTLDGVSVYQTRLAMGEKLAAAWQEKFSDCLPDVVVPAPFTSNTAAIAFARVLNVRYAEGLYKNPFIGRTFIMPNQAERHRQVRYKLMPQKTELAGRSVLILDDSIVRGNTSREIVRIVREAGAKEIYFVSACPPVKHPCFYGIDMPSQNDLLAANKNDDAIRDWLGVDRLLYQTENNLVEAVFSPPHNPANEIQFHRKNESPSLDSIQPCMACLNGCYVTGKVTDNEKTQLKNARRNVGEIA
ncbi:MAG: amidophosphoribosyltransferase [Gammaproteobacteria bacterium]|nr:amidophosphoribosyltransferase [Gammaproteobacteria bacterium]